MPIFQPPLGGLHPSRSQCGVGHQGLAVEIAGLDVATVRENELPDARRGQIGRYRATHAADARDQDGRALELLLAGFPVAGNPHLPLVGCLLFGVEGDAMR